jgi:hypothetical protein
VGLGFLRECNLTANSTPASLSLWDLGDLDGDGVHETFVREIPTRLDDAQLQLLGKTYSQGDADLTIPAGENLIDLPIFHGLGIKIGSRGATWYDSWRSAGPGTSELFTVTEEVAYDHLFFRQVIPPGSWASFIVSATIENYPVIPATGRNNEDLYKLHDGGRLVYRQQIAGPNRYEVYDAHVHAAEGLRSDGVIEKTGGPLQVSVYSDTLMFTIGCGISTTRATSRTIMIPSLRVGATTTWCGRLTWRARGQTVVQHRALAGRPRHRPGGAG